MKLDNKIELQKHQYTFYTMPPTVAFPLLFRFFKTFGQPIATLLVHETVPDDDIVRAMIQAFAQGDSTEVLELFRMVFTYVRQDNGTIELDENFFGENKNALKIFFYALVFNFADFLDANLLAFVLNILTSPSSN